MSAEQFDTKKRQSTTSTTGLLLASALVAGCTYCNLENNFEYEYLKSKNELRYTVDRTRIDSYVEDNYTTKIIDPLKEFTQFEYSAKFNLAVHELSLNQKELDRDMVKILDDMLLEKQSKPANFKF